MTDTTHLEEEQLLEYLESAEGSGNAGPLDGGSPQNEVADHLQGCARCSDALALLRQDLVQLRAVLDPMQTGSNSVGAVDPGGRGERIWQSLRPRLVAASRPPAVARIRPGSWNLRVSIALAAAAAILVAAFLAGRVWEQHRANLAARNSPGTPAIPVVIVMSDHLDRTERLLVELNHPDEAAIDPNLQATARQLLAENSLCRNPQVRIADVEGNVAANPSLRLTLDDLDRVLAAISNRTAPPSPNELTHLQQQIEAGGLLFEVRVLRSQVRSGQSQVAVSPRGGQA